MCFMTGGTGCKPLQGTLVPLAGNTLGVWEGREEHMPKHWYVMSRDENRFSKIYEN